MSLLVYREVNLAGERDVVFSGGEGRFSRARGLACSREKTVCSRGKEGFFGGERAIYPGWYEFISKLYEVS